MNCFPSWYSQSWANVFSPQVSLHVLFRVKSSVAISLPWLLGSCPCPGFSFRFVLLHLFFPPFSVPTCLSLKFHRMFYGKVVSQEISRWSHTEKEPKLFDQWHPKRHWFETWVRAIPSVCQWILSPGEGPQGTTVYGSVNGLGTMTSSWRTGLCSWPAAAHQDACLNSEHRRSDDRPLTFGVLSSRPGKRM